MAKMRIYIAGPMRGYKYYNFPAFDDAKRMMQARYPDAEIISPADIDRAQSGFNPFALPEDFDWNTIPDSMDKMDIIRRDVDAVLSCTHIHTLPNWWKSTGAQAEMALAKWAGLERVHDRDYKKEKK